MNLVAHHIDSTQAAEAIFIEIYNLAGFMSIERDRERERKKQRDKDACTHAQAHTQTNAHKHMCKNYL